MSKKTRDHPPRFASRILERLMIKAIREGAAGDFNEHYLRIVQEKGDLSDRNKFLPVPESARGIYLLAV